MNLFQRRLSTPHILHGLRSRFIVHRQDVEESTAGEALHRGTEGGAHLHVREQRPTEPIFQALLLKERYQKSDCHT